MSTAEPTIRQGSQYACGHCDHVSVPDAMYCSGCGLSLFELCTGCGKNVRLNQRFCNDCGENLEESLRSRIQAAAQTIEKAISTAKASRFDAAIESLRVVANNNDFRFRASSHLATRSIEKVVRARDQTLSRLQVASATAAAAMQRLDHAEVVSQLSGFAEVLLDEQQRRWLVQCKSTIELTRNLKADLKAAIGEKNWPYAAGCLERLIEMYPSAEEYRSLCLKIVQRLTTDAIKSYDRQDYSGSLDLLESIPAAFNSDEAIALRRKAETAVWLLEQFPNEPFATPTLGRLAVRLAKHCPGDVIGKQLFDKISSQLKEAASTGQWTFPNWSNNRQSTVGGEVTQLGAAKSIIYGNHESLRQHPSRFSIAIGLALQGLDNVLIDGNLLEKKGLFSGFAGIKKTNFSWGVDIGSSGIRAVKLERERDHIKVAQTHFVEFPQQVIINKDSPSSDIAIEAIKHLVKQHSIGDTGVWTNFPGRETLPRFLLLPPVPDKKAQQLLAVEVAGQFPVPEEQLAVIKWMSPAAGIGVGRPAALIAARKTAVQQRVDFLAHAGLKVAGLQAEPVAILNFAHREFSGELKHKEGERTEPCFAMIDAGATNLTVALIDQDGIWFRCVDSGGNDLTMAIARSVKVVASEAEALKRDPSRLPHPSEQFAEVEDRQRTLQVRLTQILGEPLKNRPQLAIRKMIVTGGAALCHGWVKHVLCSQNQS